MSKKNYLIILLATVVGVIIFHEQILFRIHVLYYIHPVSESISYSATRDSLFSVKRTLSGNTIRDTSVQIEYDGIKEWDVVSEWTFTKHGVPIRYLRMSYSRGLYFQKGWENDGKLSFFVTYVEDSTSNPDTSFTHISTYDADSVLLGYEIHYKSKEFFNTMGYKAFNADSIEIDSKVY